jgi:hypothetical protein
VDSLDVSRPADAPIIVHGRWTSLNAGRSGVIGRQWLLATLELIEAV